MNRVHIGTEIPSLRIYKFALLTINPDRDPISLNYYFMSFINYIVHVCYIKYCQTTMLYFFSGWWSDFKKIPYLKFLFYFFQFSRSGTHFWYSCCCQILDAHPYSVSNFVSTITQSHIYITPSHFFVAIRWKKFRYRGHI